MDLIPDQQAAWDRGVATAKQRIEGTLASATTSVTAPGGGLDWCLRCQRPLPRKTQITDEKGNVIETVVQPRHEYHCDCDGGSGIGDAERA